MLLQEAFYLSERAKPETEHQIRAGGHALVLAREHQEKAQHHGREALTYHEEHKVHAALGNHHMAKTILKLKKHHEDLAGTHHEMADHWRGHK